MCCHTSPTDSLLKVSSSARSRAFCVSLGSYSLSLSTNILFGLPFRFAAWIVEANPKLQLGLRGGGLACLSFIKAVYCCAFSDASPALLVQGADGGCVECVGVVVDGWWMVDCGEWDVWVVVREGCGLPRTGTKLDHSTLNNPCIYPCHRQSCLQVDAPIGYRGWEDFSAKLGCLNGRILIIQFVFVGTGISGHN